MYDGHKCGFYVFYLSKGHKQSDLSLSSGFFSLIEPTEYFRRELNIA